MKKLISCMLTVLVICSAVLLVPIEAVSAADNHTLEISTAEDLLSLASNCRYDQYSAGLTVELKNDIDLNGKSFDGIPYFGGVFKGNGHTIQNIRIKSDGSVRGFFRYTSDNARIVDLHIKGSVMPSGSRSTVGGLVGRLSGTVVSCSFEGTVKGVDSVGGIAGTSSGLIDNCTFSGKVTGEHKIGGIAGENTGVISECQNKGAVNHELISVTSQKSIKSLRFDIAEISESDFLDITDIGGISGLSSGTIRGCENSGFVGYEKTGYNVGGIAGRQSGRIEKCINKADICGRKDVGGIVGQAEPYAEWDFSDSKLQELQDTLQSIREHANRLKQNAGGSRKEIKDKMDELESSIRKTSQDAEDTIRVISSNFTDAGNAAMQSIKEIRNALQEHNHQKTKTLLRQLKEQLRPDENTIMIDVNELLDLLDEIRLEEKQHMQMHLEDNGSLSAEMEQIIAQTQFQEPDIEGLYNDLQQIASDASAMKKLIGEDATSLKSDAEALMEALSHLSGALTVTQNQLSEIDTKPQDDISAEDPERFKHGVIVGCTHQGNVTSDTNAGGIAGAAAFEIEFDSEDKLNISDYLLTNARYLIFSVIKDCESGGEIAAKKEASGGIVGRADFGMVSDCITSGAIRVTGGNFCGGIAGLTKGTIIRCYSRTLLYGKIYVGGIVGQGFQTKECKAFSYIKSGSEFCGAIAGFLEDSAEGCYYVENANGGIDGVGYKGKAEPVTYAKMRSFKDVPDLFRKIRVTFLAEDKTVAVIDVPFGGHINKLPEVPMDGVRYWKWDSFDNQHIYYSLTVEGSYKNPRTTISTDEEVPLYLAEGNFYEGQTMTAEEFKPEKTTEAFKKRPVVKAVRLKVDDCEGVLRFRMKMTEKGDLYCLNSDGSYQQLNYDNDGSYIVFKAENNSRLVFVKRTVLQSVPWGYYVLAGVLLIGGVVLVIILIRRKKNTKEIPAPSSDIRSSDNEQAEQGIEEQQQTEPTTEIRNESNENSAD